MHEPTAFRSVPFCVECLGAIRPRRMLDIGVGFGRWAMLARELLDPWEGGPAGGRAVEIEGLEPCPRVLAPHHEALYTRLHVGAPLPTLETLHGPWDLIVVGEPLRMMPKGEGLELLRRVLDRAPYVIVAIPLGEDAPPAPGDAPGVWEPADFARLPLVRSLVSPRDDGRLAGCFVLSRSDPRDLRSRLGTGGAAGADWALGAADASELERVIWRVQELVQELGYIKRHSTYRLGARLRATTAWNAARWLRTGNQRVVTLRSLRQHNPRSQGREVWLLRAAPNAGAPPVPWDFFEADGAWRTRDSEHSAFGRCLLSEDRAGRVRIPVDQDPELRFMTHPWSGRVEIRFRGRREVVDLYSPETGELPVYPGRTPMAVRDVPAPSGAGEPAGGVIVPRRLAMSAGRPGALTEEDIAEIERLRAAGATAVAVHCPRWLGVSSSTRVLFRHCYQVPRTPDREPYALSREELERHAAVLCEAGVEHVVFSGGDEVHFRLMQLLHRERRGMRFDLLWHGSYVQFREDYDWAVLGQWLDAAHAGLVGTIGTVKKGMESFFRSTGVASALVLNYLPGTPMAPPELPESPLHAGMWISNPTYRKLPYPMLAALAMIPGARLHGAGLDPRSRDVIQRFGIPVERLEERPLPHDRLFEAMRRTHLTLYVTFSECCPMVPLESMSVGVPCLLGPTSHLFEDEPYLFERLVVPFPDRADVIAEWARRAAGEREAIMEAYARYVPGYNERARGSVEAFLAGADLAAPASGTAGAEPLAIGSPARG